MNLNGNNPLTADDTYTLDGLVAGKSYLVTLYGDFGGGTLTLKYPDPTTGAIRTPENADYTENAELTVLMPSTQLRFVLAGATDPSVAVSVTPIIN